MQLGFDIDYAAGMRRGATRNRVHYIDEAGFEQQALIGDMQALELYGYRFYTTHNKGFAPTFEWTAPGREPVVGAVHLPSWPIHEYEQANRWRPGGAHDELWVMLQIDEPLADAGSAWQFRLPQQHRLIVRAGEQRQELRSGELTTLAGGSLRYLGLRRWMGYVVFYDWTLSWMLAAATLAALSLGWHYWRKFAARPWRPDD
jgi:cytochrome c biogenesis protein